MKKNLLQSLIIPLFAHGWTAVVWKTAQKKNYANVYKTYMYHRFQHPRTTLWHIPHRVGYCLVIRATAEDSDSTLVYKCLYGSGPAYLSLQRVTDVKSLGRLRSSSSSMLVVPVTRLETLADRAVRAWNALPDFVTAASTVSSFYTPELFDIDNTRENVILLNWRQCLNEFVFGLCKITTPKQRSLPLLARPNRGRTAMKTTNQQLLDNSQT